MRHLVFMLALLAAFSCDDGSSVGTEGSPCYPNHTCNEGLICLSDLCVDPNPPWGGSAETDDAFVLDGGTACSPNCAGLECGDHDGCGGVCVDCPGNFQCDTVFMDCFCEGSLCGGECCQPWETCSDEGKCLPDDVCVPDCSGKKCGDDGCGGSCGSCDPDCETCFQYSCVDAAPDCGEMECSEDDCGNSCGTCQFGYECSWDGTCECDPDCDDEECGSDGCGGSCGSCPAGELCNGQGSCVCAPSCGGKQCGSDGCGGSCGSCPAGEDCDGSGQCVSSCKVGGCSNEICSESPGFSDCSVKCWHSCLVYTQCGNYGPGGSCSWLSTPQYDQCLAGCGM